MPFSTGINFNPSPGVLRLKLKEWNAFSVDIERVQYCLFPDIHTPDPGLIMSSVTEGASGSTVTVSSQVGTTGALSRNTTLSIWGRREIKRGLGTLDSLADSCLTVTVNRYCLAFDIVFKLSNRLAGD